MKVHPERYRAHPGKKVNLRRWATETKRLYRSEDDYRDLLDADVKKLSSLQQLLYADGTYSLLLIFQAMDAAGKDGAISHVMSGVNPEGIDVHSFKQPSAEELAHDFLWRSTCRLPVRGHIGIFNRSYYEEVLILRVHPGLLKSEGLPAPLLRDPDLWEHRYQSIADFERHLHRNGTRVIKFFLHLSKEEQRKRFLERIDQPDKNWKFSAADIKERGRWADYARAYEAAIAATSTKASPWYIVPADDKLNARLIVSRVVIDALKDLNLRYPVVSQERRKELHAIRRQLRGKG